MAFTDHSDLFVAVHEDGINKVVRQIMHQRPSLFNYATAFFHQNPEFFCAKIEAAKSVVEAGNPLFTEIEPLPILGAPVPLGVNFCLQLTNAEIDFHPGNVFGLPPELGSLPAQRFALRVKACAGIDCPPKDIFDKLLPELERLIVERQLLAVGRVEEKEDEKSKEERERERLAGAAASARMAVFDRQSFKPRDVFVLPTRELICFCLELFAIGHFEWGDVPGSGQKWLKPRLDALEVVDLHPPAMESAIECYLATVLRLGILPRAMVPMEKLVLDITAVMKDHGFNIGQQVNLVPSAVPGDVPNNPAVEQHQLKGFIKLTVTGGP